MPRPYDPTRTASPGVLAKSRKRSARFSKIQPIPTGEAHLDLHLRSREAQAVIPPSVRHLVFAPDLGRWHFDFAWPDEKLAIEIDGDVHRLSDRWERDLEKFNVATCLGWRVYHFKNAQAKDGTVLDFLLAYFRGKDLLTTLTAKRNAADSRQPRSGA